MARADSNCPASTCPGAEGGEKAAVERPLLQTPREAGYSDGREERAGGARSAPAAGGGGGARVVEARAPRAGGAL